MDQEQPRTIEWYLNEIPKHMKPGFDANDMDWLLNCSIKLSTLLPELGDKVSKAKFAEYQVAVTYMDAKATDSAKKMSNAEAEKRAVVETENEYQRLDLYLDGVKETIYAIKKKVDTYTQLTKAGA